MSFTTIYPAVWKVFIKSRAGLVGTAKPRDRYSFSVWDLKKIDFLIEQKSSPEERRISRQQLRQVVDYAEGTDCRRTIILRYFGERYRGNCGKCDNCLNPKPIEDWTIEAQKFLSCVVRCREKFGAMHIVDVLRGSRKQKIQQYGHHLLSTYGIGKDRSSDEWKMLARSLLHQGLMAETSDGYRILKLNKASWEILRKQRSVEIAVSQPDKLRTLTNNPRKAEAELLFDRLRRLRKQIADRQSVPPYVIFADSSLKLMAQVCPTTIESFANLSGVNQHKAQQYGASFISVIRDFTERHKLPIPVPSGSQMITLQLHQQGLSAAEIAKVRGMAMGTINTHLSELIEMNQPVALNRLVTPDKQQAIIQTIEKLGDNLLKPLKEHLGQEYSYEDIRLVRGWWRSQQNSR